MSKAITARKMFPVKIFKLIPGVFLAFVMLFAGAGVQAQTLPAGTRIQDAAQCGNIRYKNNVDDCQRCVASKGMLWVTEKGCVGASAAPGAVTAPNAAAPTAPQGHSSTAQLVETSVGRFYQKDALSWEMNGRTLYLLERGIFGAITLQDIKTLDQYTLDFSQSRVFLLQAQTYLGVDIGQITKVMEASGPGLNGISLLLGMSDRMIHMDADRYFAAQGNTIDTALASDGSPGQWGRFFYTRMGTSVVPTKGQNVNRVDLSNGDRFV